MHCDASVISDVIWWMVKQEIALSRIRPGGEGKKWGHLAEDERLSFLGTFVCVVYEKEILNMQL